MLDAYLLQSNKKEDGLLVKIFVFLLCLCPVIAYSEPTELLCVGTEYAYPDGITQPPDTSKQNMKIIINTDDNTVEVTLLDGRHTLRFNELSNGVSIYSTYNYEPAIRNGSVISETINLDRYTGEMKTFLLSDKFVGFPTFKGKCKKIDKLF